MVHSGCVKDLFLSCLEIQAEPNWSYTIFTVLFEGFAMFFWFNKFSGWWFGCHFLFSHIMEIIIPIDELIFFRGVAQPPSSIQRPFWLMMTGSFW